MHECQRVLNGGTGQIGPLRASFAEVVDVVTLAPAAPDDIPAVGTEDRDAGDPRAGEDGAEHVAEHGAAGEVVDEADADECGKSRRPLQVFSETTSLRDDWLHRGFALADMDL